jgi:hypothetical protein
VAAQLRYAGDVGGLVVPSAAFPDRMDRGNAVVFLDDPRSITGVVTSPARVGTCRHALGASHGVVDDGRATRREPPATLPHRGPSRRAPAWSAPGPDVRVP